MSVPSQGVSHTTSSAKPADLRACRPPGIPLAMEITRAAFGCFKHGFFNEEEVYACK